MTLAPAEPDAPAGLAQRARAAGPRAVDRGQHAPAAPKVAVAPAVATPRTPVPTVRRRARLPTMRLAPPGHARASAPARTRMPRRRLRLPEPTMAAEPSTTTATTPRCVVAARVVAPRRPAARYSSCSLSSAPGTRAAPLRPWQPRGSGTLVHNRGDSRSEPLTSANPDRYESNLRSYVRSGVGRCGFRDELSRRRARNRCPGR